MGVFYCDGFIMVLIREFHVRRCYSGDGDPLGEQMDQIPESDLSPGAKEYFADRS